VLLGPGSVIAEGNDAIPCLLPTYSESSGDLPALWAGRWAACLLWLA